MGGNGIFSKRGKLRSLIENSPNVCVSGKTGSLSGTLDFGYINQNEGFVRREIRGDICGPGQPDKKYDRITRDLMNSFGYHVLDDIDEKSLHLPVKEIREVHKSPEGTIHMKEGFSIKWHH